MGEVKKSAIPLCQVNTVLNYGKLEQKAKKLGRKWMRILFPKVGGFPKRHGDMGMLRYSVALEHETNRQKGHHTFEASLLYMVSSRPSSAVHNPASPADWHECGERVLPSVQFTPTRMRMLRDCWKWRVCEH